MLRTKLYIVQDVFLGWFRVLTPLPVLIKISLKFVPKGPIDNNQALFQIMAWRGIGDKPWSEPMLNWFTDAMRH